MLKLILIGALWVSVSPQLQQIDLKLVSLSSLFKLHRWPSFHLSLPYPWGFSSECNPECLWPVCLDKPSHNALCSDIDYKHHCCEKYTQWSSSTTSTSTTSPSTTSTTENPVNKLCVPSPAECSPEPGCSRDTISLFPWNHLLIKEQGCEHHCWRYCFNPCACKTAANGNCEYHKSGMCIVRRACDDMLFQKNECRRSHSIYSIGGVLCQNHQGHELMCTNSYTIHAVNVGGGVVTDRRMIEYEPDDGSSVIVQDEFNTKVNHNVIEDIEDQDRLLYGTFGEGNARGDEHNQCIFYLLRVVDSGHYELAIRTMEPKYDTVGKRLFSATLNDLPIVDHVDIRALSKQRVPVNIVINFNIEPIPHESRKRLIVKGENAREITNYIRLGFCLSNCRFCKEHKHINPGYIVSGFSLIRFGGKGK